MKQVVILLLLLAFLIPAFAHNETTGDPTHDQNAEHVTQTTTTTDYTTPQSVGEKSVASWEQAAPFVIVLFVGLGLFAFAMGAVLNPRK